jgi:hypothetical protein
MVFINMLLHIYIYIYARHLPPHASLVTARRHLTAQHRNGAVSKAKQNAHTKLTFVFPHRYNFAVQYTYLPFDHL